MEKRIFLAVLISIALLWVWAALAPKLFPELAKPKPAATKTQPATTTGGDRTSRPLPPSSTQPSAAAPTPAQAPAVTMQPIEATSLRESVVDTPLFVARFSNRGGQLVSFRLKAYRTDDDQMVELVRARDPRSADYPFALQTSNAALAARGNTALYQVAERVENNARVLEYRYAGGGVAVTKTFRIDGDYEFSFDVRVSPPVPYRVVIGPGIRTLDPDEQDTQFLITGSGVIQQAGELEIVHRDKADRVSVIEGVDFIGIEDNYFLSVLRPKKSGDAILRRIDIPQPKSKDKRRELYAGLNATSDGAVAGDVFFGPKQTNVLEKHGLASTLQFGWFGFIARWLLDVLVWLNQATQNYGWSIVVLTIIIKIVLYPLQHKSIVSMKRMQKVQPKMEAIKNKYKKARTDPEQRQKMNTEMMKLYQQEGINPMGGCLPILLQLPILWGFYGLLSRAIELRDAPFMLWITDLSEKDPYYITPILMTATMFIQTAITPTTADPVQRRMFLLMPLIFGFMFKEFPSGLVLYWLVQNILTIIQQLIMNKWWKEHPDELQTA